MKTNIYTTALIALMILSTTIFVQASPISFEEEAYIDDIPFNTELISEKVILENTFSFESEDYVNDIPFDTYQLANGNMENQETTIDFEEEAYIDDIPFNTDTLMNRNTYTTSVNIDFFFEEESYIDDIPFDTKLLVNSIDNKPIISYFYIETHQTVLF